jgi:hypothetical protein
MGYSSHCDSIVTTVFVRQGHYAHDREANAKYPAADVSLERIGEFTELDPARFLVAASIGGKASA